MNKKEQIKAYWSRISKIEERIDDLAKKGSSYNTEVNKRKSLINNVKRLEKKWKINLI